MKVCNNINILICSCCINLSSIFLLSFTQPDEGCVKAATCACSWSLYSYSL